MSERSHKLKKIPMVRTRGRRAGTVREFRKETNDELLRKSEQKTGFVRLNLALRIRDTDTGNYAGWQGSSLIVDAPSVEKAKEFNSALRSAVLRICQEHGLTLPSAIVMEK